MSAMETFGGGERRAPAAGITRLPARRRRRFTCPPGASCTCRRSSTAPAGNSGDFFEVIQLRDGRVTVVLADVCGNGPSAAAPVGNLRWVLRQAIARGAGAGRGARGAERMDGPAAGRRSIRHRRLRARRRRDRPGGDRQRRTPRPVRPARRAAAPRILPPPPGWRWGSFPGRALPGDAPSSSRPRTRWCWSPTGSPIAWPATTIGWDSARSASGSQRARLGAESICGALLGAERPRHRGRHRAGPADAAPPPPRHPRRARRLSAVRRAQAIDEASATHRRAMKGASAAIGGRALARRRRRRARPRPPADDDVRRDRLPGGRRRRRRSDLAAADPVGRSGAAARRPDAARRRRSCAAGCTSRPPTGGETRLCARVAATLAPDPTAPEPTIVFVERFACGPGARTLHLRYDLFFDHDPYHASYTRSCDVGARRQRRRRSVGVVDRLPQPAHEIAVDVHLPEPLWRSALTYLRLGVAHILTGADHLAFLAALLLAPAADADAGDDRADGGHAAPGDPRRRSAIVSAFTVAHSITLVTQVLRPGRARHPLGRAGHRLLGRLRRLREPGAARAARALAAGVRLRAGARAGVRLGAARDRPAAPRAACCRCSRSTSGSSWGSSWSSASRCRWWSPPPGATPRAFERWGLRAASARAASAPPGRWSRS